MSMIKNIQDQFNGHIQKTYHQSRDLFMLFFRNLHQEEILVSLGRFFLLPSLIQTTLISLSVSPVIALSSVLKNTGNNLESDHSEKGYEEPKIDPADTKKRTPKR